VRRSVQSSRRRSDLLVLRLRPTLK
jgi:hypothetical protein